MARLSETDSETMMMEEFFEGSVGCEVDRAILFRVAFSTAVRVACCLMQER